MSIKQCVVLASVAAAASAAQAQWTFTVLESGSQAAFPSVNAVYGNRQGGAIDNGLQAPVLWSGQPGTATYLPLPPLTSGVAVTGMSATGIVGEGYLSFSDVDGIYAVFLWDAEGTTFTTIEPPAGFTGAFAAGIAGDQQVGSIENVNVGDTIPTLWRGTAASRVNLRPAGYPGGRAYATDGVHQAGELWTEAGNSVAALWSGTAASFVSLHPSSGWLGSGAAGVSDGRQCGYVYNEVAAHAVVWSGTAASMVSLHPDAPGVLYSYAEAISGTVICGSMYTDTPDGMQDHAVVWTSPDASSYVDLHSLLGPDYYGSRAHAVWTDGNGLIHVAGEGENAISGWTDAIVWTLDATPNCPPDFNGDGFLDFFDYDDFVVCYETEVCGGGTADFNGDGFIDFFDYDDFVVAYETGC